VKYPNFPEHFASKGNFEMILHESMHKYKSQLDVLDVLNWAHSTPPATLNRQIITLLSTLGVPDEV
jgi:RNA-dependent RNA polymerase